MSATKDQEYVNRILTLKTGELIKIPERKPPKVAVDAPPHRSNIYAEFKWNNDRTLSSLTMNGKTYHFIWNSDGTLYNITKT